MNDHEKNILKGSIKAYKNIISYYEGRIRELEIKLNPIEKCCFEKIKKINLKLKVKK